MDAGALVGVHRRPERPRPPHPAQPRHITRRQTGGGAHIHRTTKTRYSYVPKERPHTFIRHLKKILCSFQYVYQKFRHSLIPTHTFHKLLASFSLDGLFTL